MDKISVKDARKETSIGRQATLQGWVRTRRDSKAGFSFIEINDGSSQANIQIIADADLPNYESEIKKLSAGCSLTATGEIKESGGRGQKTEMHASTVEIVGWADPEEYPLQKNAIHLKSCANGLICEREPIRSAPSPGFEIVFATPSTSFSRNENFCTFIPQLSLPATAKERESCSRLRQWIWNILQRTNWTNSITGLIFSTSLPI